MRTFLITSAGALLMTTAVSAQQVITTTHLAGLDTDGDGAVAKAEMDSFAAQAFEALDTNGDGYISQTELVVIATPEMFAAANTNGDDGISVEEFKARIAADFVAADKDANGTLD